LTRVPGTWTSEYESIYIDNRCFVDCLGWRIFLTHTPESHYRDLVGDIKPERVIQKKDCDLFLHGHTHRPAIEERGGLTVLNPGHLKADIDRGYPATYATISLSNLQAHIKVFKLIDGSVLLEKTIDKRTSK
jgi:predicted phosphodiesterase